MTIDQAIAAIRKLGLPQRRAQRAWWAAQHEQNVAAKEHKRLGAVLTAHMIYWSRDAKHKSAVPEPVKPYLRLRVGLSQCP